MYRFICLLFISLVSLPAHAGENILTPYIGLTKWSDTSDFTVRGTSLSFDDSAETTFGFRYLYMFDSGLAIGADFYLYRMDVVNPIQADDAGVFHTHALVEYFFMPKESVSPFIGGGIGFSAIGFSGGVLDDDGSAGSSIELNAGVQFRVSQRVGIQLEYKYTNFNMNENIDSLSTKIDSTANSFMLGVSIFI